MSTREHGGFDIKAGLIGVAAIVLGLLTTACSSNSTEADEGSAADRQYLFGNISAQRQAVKARQVARTLEEYLPNQLFVVGDGPAKPEAVGIVRGTVIDAVGARGYYIPGDAPDADAPGGTEVAFDDPRAQWRVIDITVDVEDTTGIDPVKQVHIGVVADGPDTDSLLRGARSLGEVVVVLDRQGFFKSDPQLYNIGDFNALLGTVRADGTITFPALGDEADEFVGDLTTWEDVDAELIAKKQPIKTDLMGNRIRE